MRVSQFVRKQYDDANEKELVCDDYTYCGDVDEDGKPHGDGVMTMKNHHYDCYEM